MKRAVLCVLFLLLAALFLLPVLGTAGLSFWDGAKADFGGYVDLLFDCFPFYDAFWNSALYAGAVTLAGLLITVPCAFAFEGARFRGKGLLFVFYIVLMMTPLQVTILPNYIGLRDFGLLDTRLGIILPAAFSPFGVVVMRQYMQGMDNSVVEAIRLETNSVLRAMIHTILPQVKVCVFAVAVFIFADTWNMLEQPLLFLKSEGLQNLTVFISRAGNYYGDILFPASVLFIVPALLLYAFFSDALEKGLTFGGLAK